MKTFKTVKAIIALLALQVSCGDMEDDAEDIAGQMTYPTGYSQSKDSRVTLSFQGATGGAALVEQIIQVSNTSGADVGALTLTKAQIVLDKIKIKMEAAGSTSSESSSASLQDSSESEGESESETGDDSAELEFEFPGPFLVDLLNNTVTPDPGELELPAGNYKEIVLSMHKVEDEDATALGIDSSDPMYGHSFLVDGTYTVTGGSARNFNMAYEFGEDFKMRGSRGMDISAESLNNMVVAFRLAKWFDFANPETNDKDVNFEFSGSGDIVLNKDSDNNAKDIRKVIKENAKESADFGKDEDGDGVLTNDEDAEDASEEDDED